MDIINAIAPHAVPYISITGLATGQTYTYRKRFGKTRMPVVNHVLHHKKAGLGSMLYLAVPAIVNLHALKASERLYVGCQSAVDRMFRGDGLRGNNFHHAQMRDGNNGKGLLQFLSAGGKVEILAVPSDSLIRLCESASKYRKIVTDRHIGANP